MSHKINLEDVALATGTPIDELRNVVNESAVDSQLSRGKDRFLYVIRHMLAQHGRCAMYLSKTGRILFVDYKQLKGSWSFVDRGSHLRGRPSNRKKNLKAQAPVKAR
jgi:rhodanese-related sulfurtransferase